MVFRLKDLQLYISIGLYISSSIPLYIVPLESKTSKEVDRFTPFIL